MDFAKWAGLLNTAGQVVSKAAVRTPLLESPALNKLVGRRVLVKAESLQVHAPRGGHWARRGTH